MPGQARYRLEHQPIVKFNHLRRACSYTLASIYASVDKWVDQLQAVPADAIPTAPGVCFGAGTLLDPIRADQMEKAMLFAGLPGHPDVRIAFNTMAGLNRTWPTLLERRAQVNTEQPLWERLRFSTLRWGPRTIHGLAGEEAVMKVTELNFSVVYGPGLGATRHARQRAETRDPPRDVDREQSKVWRGAGPIHVEPAGNARPVGQDRLEHPGAPDRARRRRIGPRPCCRVPARHTSDRWRALP